MLRIEGIAMKYFLIVFGAIIFLLTVIHILDCLIIGKLNIHRSSNPTKEKYIITKTNRIDFQNDCECSAFSSAFVLRHLGIEANGFEIYNNFDGKLSNGAVIPKSILKLFRSKGYKAALYRGNLDSLKSELQKGIPIIILIRTDKDKNWLHYVPVVGFDSEYFYIADSLEYLANCDCEHYNRKIEIKDFYQYWKTNTFYMPFYKNTFIVISK